MSRPGRHPRAPARGLLPLLSVLALLGCAGAAGTGGESSSNVITREQIDAIPEGTAYTIIQRYRASWLRPRTRGLRTGQPDLPRVYLDELEYGDLDSLRGIAGNRILSIEFIDSLDATTRYGTGYAGGLIRIVTRGL